MSWFDIIKRKKPEGKEDYLTAMSRRMGKTPPKRIQDLRIRVKVVCVIHSNVIYVEKEHMREIDTKLV